MIMEMKHKNFAAMILTHGRPDNVITYKTLRRSGYTGDIVIVIDTEDKRADEYKSTFKNIYQFDKRETAKTFDEMGNFDDRRAIVYARNKSFEIAEELGYRYFIELDDDYEEFSYTFKLHGELKRRVIGSLNKIFDAMIDFLNETPTTTIAMAQGGDFIGGAENPTIKNKRLKRKAMNSFVCDIEKSFKFIGRINEDVNTYTLEGSRGKLFFTFPQVMLNQKQTQSNKGGMTDIYLDSGTYIKSFYTVMAMPSSVCVAKMGDVNMRLHHKVKWNNTVPKILSENYKKK